jgi:hypothetical protein
MTAKLRKVALGLIAKVPVCLGLVDERLIGVSLAFICMLVVANLLLAVGYTGFALASTEAELVRVREKRGRPFEPTSFRAWCAEALLELLLLGFYGWPLLVLVALPARAALLAAQLLLREAMEAAKVPAVRVPEGSVLYAPAREEAP